MILDKGMPKNKSLLNVLKKLQQGSVGNIVVIGVMALMVGVGAAAIDGFNPAGPPNNGEEVKVVSPTPDSTKQNLQLQTFGYVTIAPTPATVGNLCKAGGVNEEPFILIGYSPAEGQTVDANGQIKVWVSDENPPFIAPGEVVDPSTGQITTPGDRSAKAEDNYLYEPSLYIAPNTVESGGTPHFPNIIKGTFNSQPGGNKAANRKNAKKGPAMDPPPSSNPQEPEYQAEYIWNVNSLGLSAGTYQAEFVIHDGDTNRGVGCVNIKIQ